MKSVLLIGLGRFGRHMAAKLQELHHEVLAVDKNEERVNDALDLVTHAQIGDSTSEAFIASLGVRNFDLCVVAIGDDFQSSLETTALLKEQGARFVLSRAARDVHAKFLLRNGADDVVYPERETASWAAVRYSSDHIFDYIQLTPLEFAILWYLCEHRGQVVPSEELFEAVWGEKYMDSNNTVMSHIARLREKMHEPSRKPKFIKTVWGVGYTIE